MNAGTLDHLALSPGDRDHHRRRLPGLQRPGTRPVRQLARRRHRRARPSRSRPNGSCSGTRLHGDGRGRPHRHRHRRRRHGTASLTVTAGSLDHITISPASATIAAGESQAYTAQGVDQYGNSLGDVTAHDDLHDRPGRLLHRQRLHRHRRRIAHGHRQRRRQDRHRLAHRNRRRARPSRALARVGVDHLGRLAELHRGGRATSTATRSAMSPRTRPSRSRPTAPARPRSARATAAGAHTVTGTVLGATGTASLTVTAGGLDHIAISPSSATRSPRAAPRPTPRRASTRRATRSAT